MQMTTSVRLERSGRCKGDRSPIARTQGDQVVRLRRGRWRHGARKSDGKLPGTDAGKLGERPVSASQSARALGVA